MKYSKYKTIVIFSAERQNEHLLFFQFALMVINIVLNLVTENFPPLL